MVTRWAPLLQALYRTMTSRKRTRRFAMRVTSLAPLTIERKGKVSRNETGDGEEEEENDKMGGVERMVRVSQYCTDWETAIRMLHALPCPCQFPRGICVPLSASFRLHDICT